MHVLIAFAVIVGFIAYAFGPAMARTFVRACAAGALIAFAMAVVFVAVELLRPEPDTAIGKIPEDTPELRRLCTEWKMHPNDAPRMCFGVLE